MGFLKTTTCFDDNSSKESVMLIKFMLMECSCIQDAILKHTLICFRYVGIIIMINMSSPSIQMNMRQEINIRFKLAQLSRDSEIKRRVHLISHRLISVVFCAYRKFLWFIEYVSETSTVCSFLMNYGSLVYF